MKIVQAYNRHRFGGGLDIVAEATTNLLTSKNDKVLSFIRDSRDLGKGLCGKIGRL